MIFLSLILYNKMFMKLNESQNSISNFYDE